MSKALRLAFLLCWSALALSPWASLHAAELGAVLTRSFLDQPLNITMQVKLSAGERFSDLQCQMGLPDDYTSVGLSKPSFVDDIQCQIQAGKKPNQANAILTLRSSASISEPVFNLVVLLSSPQDAHQIRDFLVVLDVQAASDLAVTPVSKDIQSDGNTSAIAGQDYLVGANETLMNVARQIGVSELEFNQFMLAVLQRNPQAFIDNNIHLLKQGSLLKLPTQQEWQSVNPQQANEEVQSQQASWREYRQQKTMSEPGNESQAKSNAQTTTEPSNTSRQARDIVRLSNSATANSKVVGLTVQEEINALRDEMAAHEASIKEANLKTAALEQQIQAMQKLILIKDKALQLEEQQRPWWSKLSRWLAQHPWAFIVLLLGLMLLFLLAVHQLSKRRAEQALQAMLAEIRPTQSATVQEETGPAQAGMDPASVLEKTSQLLQGIDLDLSKSSNPAADKSLHQLAASASAMDTQFDLVASYMDMGDHIGASKLLQEIIQNGNPAQQDKARQLLGRLN